MLVGLAIALPIAALAGWPDDLGADTVVRLVISGAGNVIGLALVYTGVRFGRVGVITSVASTQGAIAALLAIIDGERPEPVTLAGFAFVGVGVAMVVYQAAEAAEAADPRAARLSILLGSAAAVIFGISLFATGQASQDVPSAWIALPARIVGVGVLLVVLAAGMRPLGRPAAARLAAAAGVFEVIGFVSFAVGAKEGIAITSVVASQFAALVVVGAFLVFRERLSRRQVAGVGVLAVGVALVALGGRSAQDGRQSWVGGPSVASPRARTHRHLLRHALGQVRRARPVGGAGGRRSPRRRASSRTPRRTRRRASCRATPSRRRCSTSSSSSARPTSPTPVIVFSNREAG